MDLLDAIVMDYLIGNADRWVLMQHPIEWTNQTPGIRVLPWQEMLEVFAMVIFLMLKSMEESDSWL